MTFKANGKVKMKQAIAFCLQLFIRLSENCYLCVKQCKTFYFYVIYLRIRRKEHNSQRKFGQLRKISCLASFFFYYLSSLISFVALVHIVLLQKISIPHQRGFPCLISPPTLRKFQFCIIGSYKMLDFRTPIPLRIGNYYQQNGQECFLGTTSFRAHHF